jgi:hypothetical protein
MLSIFKMFGFGIKMQIWNVQVLVWFYRIERAVVTTIKGTPQDTDSSKKMDSFSEPIKEESPKELTVYELLVIQFYSLFYK